MQRSACLELQEFCIHSIQRLWFLIKIKNRKYALDMNLNIKYFKIYDVIFFIQWTDDERMIIDWTNELKQQININQLHRFLESSKNFFY